MRRYPAVLAVSLLGVCPARGDEPGPRQPPERGRVMAQYLYTVADDFIVDVYHNGERVPDDKRQLVLEVHGATVEKINVEVREGDLVVFNVVNNRLRWGGASYFAVSGLKDVGSRIGFTTELASGRWSACDDPANVAKFIADPKCRQEDRARSITTPWDAGDGLMNQFADGWGGTPLWGASRNTWIKFVAR